MPLEHFTARHAVQVLATETRRGRLLPVSSWLPTPAPSPPPPDAVASSPQARRSR